MSILKEISDWHELRKMDKLIFGVTSVHDPEWAAGVAEATASYKEETGA